MADTIYESWETKLTELNNVEADKPADLHAKKNAIFALNCDDLRQIPGRIIHDDHRIVLSAPEIIIGDVNLGGILSPTSKGKIIIRGRDVSVESAGDAGSIAMRATKISQTAEDPGVDGMEHCVKSTSQIVSQACDIVLQSDDIPDNGTFPTPKTAGKGGIAVCAKNNVKVTAQKSCKTIKDDLDQEIAALEAKKGRLESDVKDNLNAFKELRKEFEKLSDMRDKIIKEEDNALRIDYLDLDELNILIDEVTMQLSKNLYEYSLRIAELKGVTHRSTSLKAQKNAVKAEDKFKEESTSTAITIASEKVSITSSDGDGNIRTNKDAGVTIAANDMKVQSAIDDKGSLESKGQMSVNMHKVLITTAGKKVEDGKPEHIEYKADGDVIITSKNIKLQTIDTEDDGKKFIDKGLTENGKIIIRSKGIGLSTVNTSDYESDDEGKAKKATYKPEGSISLYTKDYLLTSAEQQIENGKRKIGDITKGSRVVMRSETYSICANDKEGKAIGSININAKDVYVRSVDVDPKDTNIKKVAEGGTVKIGGERAGIYGEKKILLSSHENLSVIAKKNLSLRGDETAELKQGKGLLTIKGDETTLSGSKNTLHGETLIKVLQSPSITGDNVTISKAMKAPNFTDSVMVDTKDKSGASAKIDDSEDKKEDPNENQAVPGAVVTDEEQQKLDKQNPNEPPVEHEMNQKMDGNDETEGKQ